MKLRYQTSFKFASGFTLIELIITLSIISILLTIVAPSMMNTLAKNKVVSESNNLVTALQLGRSEAIRSSQRTVICKSINGTQCSTSADWKDGWLLFHDLNNNETVDNGEQIIRVNSQIDERLEFNFRSGNFVAFQANGRINENGRFCFRNNHDASNSRAVIISQVGRIRTEKRNAENDCAT